MPQPWLRQFNADMNRMQGRINRMSATLTQTGLFTAVQHSVENTRVWSGYHAANHKVVVNQSVVGADIELEPPVRGSQIAGLEGAPPSRGEFEDLVEPNLQQQLAKVQQQKPWLEAGVANAGPCAAQLEARDGTYETAAVLAAEVIKFRAQRIKINDPVSATTGRPAALPTTAA